MCDGFEVGYTGVVHVGVGHGLWGMGAWPT
jgi:hypothetical protein